MLCSYACLDENKLDELRKLEKKLGKTLLAFECHDAKPESLSDQEVSEIKELEKKLGLSVVAIQG